MKWYGSLTSLTRLDFVLAKENLISDDVILIAKDVDLISYIAFLFSNICICVGFYLCFFYVWSFYQWIFSMYMCVCQRQDFAYRIEQMTIFCNEVAFPICIYICVCVHIYIYVCVCVCVCVCDKNNKIFKLIDFNDISTHLGLCYA